MATGEELRAANPLYPAPRPPLEESIAGSHAFYSSISISNPLPREEVMAWDPDAEEDAGADPENDTAEEN